MKRQHLNRIIFGVSLWLLLLSSSSCRRNADPELFLLPNNFTGVVVVIFGTPNGEDPLFEGTRRVYEIPEGGVLNTKFAKTNHGLLDQEYYYSVGKEKIRRIENFNPDKHSLNEIYILYGEYGYCRSYGSGRSFSYMAFTVGKSDEADSLQLTMKQFLKEIEYRE